MAKYDKISPETQQEAQKIARANQKPGQTKEQTQLIAQGIQKGIDEYKKQMKARAREASRQKKLQTKAKQQPQAGHEEEGDIELVEASSALDPVAAELGWLCRCLVRVALSAQTFTWDPLHRLGAACWSSSLPTD